jgi:hypothetical protein
MERAYQRYILIKQINEFIKPYKQKYTQLLEATLWKTLYLLDSYNDIEMIKDILFCLFKNTMIFSNDVEMNMVIDKYITLYQNEKEIIVPKLEIGKFTELDEKNMFIKINKDDFKITKCAYELYKFTDKKNILTGMLFYHHDFIRINKRYPDTKIISEIIDKLEPKNVTEICPNFVEVSTLEIKNKFKKVYFNLHTFNVSINKPFGTTAHYLSDNFADNSIIYLSSILDFNMGMHLLTIVFPHILKKYKNICIVMINRFYYYQQLIEVIKNLSYINYQAFLDVNYTDILQCVTTGIKPKVYGFVACSDNFSEKLEIVKNIFMKNEYNDQNHH